MKSVRTPRAWAGSEAALARTRCVRAHALRHAAAQMRWQLLSGISKYLGNLFVHASYA